jgi:hypothetical protein
MSKTPDPVQPSKPKTLSLDGLWPAKLPVETSLGILYVRRANTSDWKHFENKGIGELATVAVRRLVSQVADKRDTGPLADEALDVLGDGDFASLASAIADHNGWGDMPDGPALQGLDQLIAVAKELERERHQKQLDDMRKLIDGNYSFLNKSVLEKLQGQVAGLADIRNGLSGAGAIGETLRSANLTGAGAIGEALRSANLTGAGAIGEAMRLPKLSDDKFGDIHLSARAIDGAMGRIDLSNAPASLESIELKVPRGYIPTRLEDTPIGRAAIESAQTTREVAKNMEALAVIVGGLNDTLVTEVLPAWFRQVEEGQRSALEGQKHAQQSFKQAATSLKWTKWAVALSVLVTVWATIWQISVARDIDHENSAQQEKMELLLREQLSTQKRLLERQEHDAGQLRELLMQGRNPLVLQADVGPVPKVANPKK